MPQLIYFLACLASGFMTCRYIMTAKKGKTSLSWKLIEEMRDEENNKILLFCSLRRGIKESQRQHVLEEIITVALVWTTDLHLMCKYLIYTCAIHIL